MAIASSPYKNARDSPSRQLLYELQYLTISSQREFCARLDREEKEKEILHENLLRAAAAEHDRVRKEAELEGEKYLLQLEAELKLQEKERLREAERLRQEKAEKEIADKKREIERVKAEEAETKKKEEARKAEAAAAEQRKAKEKQDADDARKLQEIQDAENKKKQAAIAAEKQRLAQVSERQILDPSNLKVTPSSTVSQNPEVEADHARYLAIHRNLKELRKFMMAEARKNLRFKQRMGDMRRGIKASVGQLTEGKGANKIPLSKIVIILKESLQVSDPAAEVTLFLANPPSPLPSSDTTAPALLIYLLNIFAKAVIAQFTNEAGVSPKTADPVGVIASHIFSMADFRWQGITLIDILISKMHLVCPVLWGIYGDESTDKGKARLGWWREDKGGPWISEQTHMERMTGLGAGFASLALRNYERARLDNPYPNENYWRSFSNIVDTPPALVTSTHFIVLKAMIENHEHRFLEFYGVAAIAALRRALLDFPSKATKESVAAKALAGLVDVFRREKRLIL